MNRTLTKHALYVILLLSALFFVQVNPIFAADELHLAGFVKRIDHSSKTVFINMTSSSCPGMLMFKVDDMAALDGLVGKWIEFTIDSSTCKGDTLYKMFPDGRTK